LEVKVLLESVSANLVDQIIQQKEKDAKRRYDDEYEKMSQIAGFDSDDELTKVKLNVLKFDKDKAL